MLWSFDDISELLAKDLFLNRGEEVSLKKKKKTSRLVFITVENEFRHSTSELRLIRLHAFEQVLQAQHFALPFGVLAFESLQFVAGVVVLLQWRGKRVAKLSWLHLR